MSFDVFLQKFEDGMPTNVNREDVRDVLLTREFVGPDAFGFYDVQFPDGTHVEFSAKGLNEGADFRSCTFHIRAMSMDVVKFIWEIAKAGEMVILSASENFVPILASVDQRAHLPSDLLDHDPQPVVCQSPAELDSLLSGGYDGWRNYRAQVTRGAT